MRSSASLALVALAACSASPPPPPPPPPVVAQPAPRPLAPARWVHAGTSSEGVRIAGGRLVLLLGKRALVADDGTVTPEKTPAPEPLEDLLLVPSASGQQLVGRGAKSVYRFDDPLGPGVLVATATAVLHSVEAAPDALLLRAYDEAVWVGLDGKARPRFGPPLGLRFVHFTDSKRGMALVDSAGLVATSDGGASWRSVAMDLRRYPGVDGHDGLRVAGHSIDSDTGAVTPWKAPAEPELVRWLRETRRAPLEAAVGGGVDLGNGRALVLGAERAFEVDLATGLPGRFTLLPPVEAAAPGALWRGASAGGGLFFWTELAPESANLELPFLSVTRPPEPLSPKVVPGLIATGELLPSASGALALPGGPCSERDSAPGGLISPQASCIWQPDGTRRVVWLEGYGLHAAGPTLSGGLVAAVDLSHPPPEGRGNGSPATLVRVDQKGALRKIAPLSSLDRFIAQIDEIDATTVHLLLSDDNGRTRSRVIRGATVTERDLGAGTVHYSAGKGFFIGEDAFKVTADAGRTWETVPAPSLVGPGSVLSVSSVGLAASPYLRVGWGPQAALEPLPDWTTQVATIQAPKKPAELRVACKAGKATKGLPPLLDGTLLFAPAPVSPGQAPGGASPAKQPDSRPVRMFRRNPELRTQAAAQLSGAGDKPTLTLSWIDQGEVGAKVHRASRRAPHGLARVDVYAAVSSGDRAFFELSVGGGRTVFARAVGSKIDLYEVPKEWRPVGMSGLLAKDAAIGPDGAVAWLGPEAQWGLDRPSSAVGVWLPKEAPRVVARMRGGQYAIAAPTKAGVPVVVGTKEVAAYRLVPVPTLDPKGAASAPPWLDVGGWKLAPFEPRALGALPVCGRKPAGQRFVLTASAISVAVEGWPDNAKATATAIVTDGASACLESFASIQGEHFARVDLRTAKGEGAKPPRSAAQAFALTCTVAPPR